MLKHIELSDLELGMFVQKMEGSWFDHPFWKSNFLIEDQKRLRLLKESNLRGVVIDTTKGKDVSAPVAEARISADKPNTIVSKRINAISTRTKREDAASMPVSIDKELHAAQAVANKAKERLHRTFMAARLGGKLINWLARCRLD